MEIVDFYVQNQEAFIPYNGPGSWFDPDMVKNQIKIISKTLLFFAAHKTPLIFAIHKAFSFHYEKTISARNRQQLNRPRVPDSIRRLGYLVGPFDYVQRFALFVHGVPSNLTKQGGYCSGSGQVGHNGQNG